MSNHKLTRILSLLSLRIRGLVGLLLIGALLGSCTQPVTCILYNHTSQSLTVKQLRRDQDVKISNLAPGASIELQFWETTDFEISSSHIVWSYKPVRSDVDFLEMVEYGWFGKPVVNVQLEPDGRIFLLPPGVESPVSTMPEQPKGYPLSPKMSEKS